MDGGRSLIDDDMTEHHPHHHHDPGHAHPPASVHPSILRLSVRERVAVAVLMIAVLWGIVFWAMA
jgi:hypothetical protein